MRIIRVLALGALVAFGVVEATRAEPTGPRPAAPANKYIGAAKCKNCHSSPKTGDQFGKWKEQKHAKAFVTLASDDAKKLAKAAGVEDAQKSEKCMKCHSTAYGVADDQIMKGFDHDAGVQCETCHGPGQKHMMARMAAAAADSGDDSGKEAARQDVPKEEINARPDVKICLGCHNKESPSFKPFCPMHRFKEIAHLDPRDKKAADELAAMKCECQTCECPDCKKEGGK